MSKLASLKNSYNHQEISKAEYIDKMYEIHQILFEYSKHLKLSDISRIEISDDKVLMTTRDTKINYICVEKDKRIAPIEILNFGSVEKDVMNFQLRIIEPHYNILDIGGNIGWYSMNVAKYYPNSNIHIFEPVPATFNCMVQNLEINGFNNIKTHNFGFSDSQGSFDFYYDPSISGNASMENVATKPHLTPIKCSFVTLDSFLKENKLIPDFIKCDVEGAELLVFKGGFDSIQKFKPIIFSEMLRKWSSKFGYHPNEIISFFKKLNYTCYSLNRERLIKFDEMDDSTIETNFFFFHNEKHSEKIKAFL